MHTDSSASITYLASASASEWTATVLMPISRQARWMRSAISPRLAIRTFSNMPPAPSAPGDLGDDQQDFAVFDRAAVAEEDIQHRAAVGCRDRIHHLHGLDDQQGLALRNLVANLHEGRGAGLRGGI